MAFQTFYFDMKDGGPVRDRMASTGDREYRAPASLREALCLNPHHGVPVFRELQLKVPPVRSAKPQ